MSELQVSAAPPSDVELSATILADFLSDHITEDAAAQDAKDYTFAKAIEVFVGPDKVAFTVHPSLVCTDFSCRFLQAYISGHWYDGGAIVLLHIDCDDFARYLQWIYDGSALLSVNTEKPRSPDDRDIHWWVLDYVCADQLNDIATMNFIMDDLVKLQLKLELIPSSETIQLVYRSLPPGSPMKKWMEEVVAYQAPPEVFELAFWQDKLPPETFLLEVRRLRRVGMLKRISFYVTMTSVMSELEKSIRSGPMPDSYLDLLKKNPCRYHCHDAKYTTADHGCPEAEL